tara:strand:- start:187 stop:510 length:324 start_codon:yes stop_codon:yes gene_type:complete
MASRLKNKKKIETIFEHGKTIKEKGLLLKFYEFKDGEVEFGVSVSKKLFSSAVKRNLIKRRIREQARSTEIVKKFSSGFSFFIIYTAKDIMASVDIKKRLEVLIKKI